MSMTWFFVKKHSLQEKLPSGPISTKHFCQKDLSSYRGELDIDF